MRGGDHDVQRIGARIDVGMRTRSACRCERAAGEPGSFCSDQDHETLRLSTWMSCNGTASGCGVSARTRRPRRRRSSSVAVQSPARGTARAASRPSTCGSPFDTADRAVVGSAGRRRRRARTPSGTGRRRCRGCRRPRARGARRARPGFRSAVPAVRRCASARQPRWKSKPVTCSSTRFADQDGHVGPRAKHVAERRRRGRGDEHGVDAERPPPAAARRSAGLRRRTAPPARARQDRPRADRRRADRVIAGSYGRRLPPEGGS